MCVLHRHHIKVTKLEQYNEISGSKVMDRVEAIVM